MVSIHWPTLLVLLAVVLINSTWQTAMMAPFAINRHSRIALYYIFVYGVTAAGLGYIWTAKLGICGAALSLLLAEAATAVIIIHISLPIIPMDVIQWAKTVLRPPFYLFGQAGEGIMKRLLAAPECF
jgi:hypothetical protein